MLSSSPELSLYSDNSKVLCYLSDRILPEEVQEKLVPEIQGYLDQWKAHGHPLKATVFLRHDCFLLIIIDTAYALPSGCSIDALVNFVKKTAQQLDIDFFKGGQIAYMDNGAVSQIDFRKLKEYVEKGLIHHQTKIFVPVETYKDLKEKWVLPAEITWISKYLKNSTLV